jgi:hypothetical protein
LLLFFKKEALAFAGVETKRCFFEKKKQKTFTRLGLGVRGVRHG